MSAVLALPALPVSLMAANAAWEPVSIRSLSVPTTSPSHIVAILPIATLHPTLPPVEKLDVVERSMGPGAVPLAVEGAEVGWCEPEVVVLGAEELGTVVQLDAKLDKLVEGFGGRGLVEYRRNSRVHGSWGAGGLLGIIGPSKSKLFRVQIPSYSMTRDIRPRWRFQWLVAQSD